MPTARQVSQAENGTKQRFADSLLEIGWLLLALLVPLFVNLWGKHPFEPSKAALLRALVWAMVGVWLADGLSARRPLGRELRANPLLWPAVAVAVTQVLATLGAVDKGLSLWGNPERSQGALTTVSYVLLFLVVANRLRTRDQARRLFVAIAFSTALVVTLSLMQLLGRDPVGLISDADSPIYATLGRSNFVGAYLAMAFPVTLSLTLTAREGRKQTAGALLVLGQLAVVAFTLSRGAWLAAGCAVGVFVLLWNWHRLKRGWRAVAVGGGVLALSAVVGAALWFGRVAGSTAARITIWRAALTLITRRPSLGYGPDTLELVFPQVFPPQLVYYQGRGVTVDRAHNLVLDAVLSVGVLGLAAGLVLLVLFLILGVRALDRGLEQERKVLVVACLAAVVGNAAGNLVSFEVTATATLMALLMASTVALLRGQEPESVGSVVARASARRWLCAGAALVSVAILVVACNLRPLVADAAARISEVRAVAGDWDGAIDAAERSVALQPALPQYRLWLSWVLLQRAQQEDGDPLAWLSRAETQLLAANVVRPRDYRTWAALGELYGVWGNQWDPAQFPLAHDAYRRASELAPHHATLHVAWGMVDLAGGQFVLAAERFRSAIDLDATDGTAYLRLGEAEFGLGRVEPALQAFEQAVRWTPGSSQALLGVARCYWQLGQQEQAHMALLRAQQLDAGSEMDWMRWLQSLQ